MKSNAEKLQCILADQQQIFLAVEKTLPTIERAIDLICLKMKARGRLIYVGAGTSGRIGMLDAVECVPTISASPDQVFAIIAGGTSALTHQPLTIHLMTNQNKLFARLIFSGSGREHPPVLGFCW